MQKKTDVNLSAHKQTVRRLSAMAAVTLAIFSSSVDAQESSEIQHTYYLNTVTPNTSSNPTLFGANILRSDTTQNDSHAKNDTHAMRNDHAMREGVYLEQSTNTQTSKELIDLNQADWSSAMTEIGTILVLGRLSYISGGETIERDFDYELEGNEFEYFSKRLFTDEYMKLDDNSKGMNWGHAYAGMIYHQAFRNHNFNYYESVLATFLTSTTWEVFFEYKEVVSINDQFFTTWGGAVLGEGFFQLNEMLAYKDGWVPWAFEGLFNPAKAIQGWFSESKKLRFKRDNVDDVFTVYTGVVSSSNDTRDLDKSIAVFGLNASVNSMKGDYDTFSGTPTLVELHAEAGLSSEGLEDFQLTSAIVLGGYYHQTAKKDRQAGDWKETTFIGPSVGIEYNSLGVDDDEDFYSTVNLIGVSMGKEWQKNKLRFALRASAYADFAMVNPFASKNVENYRDFYWNSKSALWENAYAYALGHTINVQFEGEYRELKFGLNVRSQRWDSIDNKEFERFGAWNPNRKDLDFKDGRDRFKFYVSYDFTENFTARLHYEQIHRDGEFFGIDDPTFYAQADDIETRSSLQLSYHY